MIRTINGVHPLIAGSARPMVRTTPPKPVDDATLFPELVPYARTAIRLHPRPRSPGPHDSSVGGPLLWPADEPWPTCPGSEHGAYSPDDGSHSTTVETVPLISIVQVHRRTCHSSAFPEGTNLLQALCCPFLIDECPSPTPRVFWRNAAAITSLLEQVPAQVIEYPSWDMPRDIREALRPRLDAMKAETGWLYNYHLAEAPGTKLGGYPSWKQEPCWPPCETCGAEMDHLRHAIKNVAGIMIGDAGGIYIFQCPTSPNRPVCYHGDCS